MSKTWSRLGRSLVRRLYCRLSIGLSVLTFCAVLPFASVCSASPYFGDDSDFVHCRVYTFVDGSTNTTYQQMVAKNSLEVFAVFSSRPFCFVMNRLTDINSPDLPSSTNDFGASSLSYCLFGQPPSLRGAYFSPRCISRVDSLYMFAFALASQGYVGRGLTLSARVGPRTYWNFDYKTAVADIVSSTNTAYRQILLSHLASIQSSIQNIDVNVSGLQSVMEQGYDDIVDALIGDYPELQQELKKGNTRAVDVRTSIKSQLQAWRNQATQQLNDWKSDLKSDLQAWKTSDETGILNIRQHIQDVTTAVDSMKNQFGTTDPQGNPVSFSAFTTNFVTVPITNVVTQSGNEISSNIQQAADMLDDRLYDIWDRFYNTAGAWDSEGINVRIVQPTDGDNHVLVKDDAVLRVLEDGVTFVSPELTQISDAWDSFLASYSPTNSLDWEPWFSKWVPFSDTVTNYYAEFNASAPASEIAADFLERGFDGERYSALPWFERVEVLLAMIADVRSNSVEVADIQEAMEAQVSNFQTLSTNVVSVSSDVVGLFQYVQRFSTSLQSIFGDRATPLTGDYVLLPAGKWIGDQPLVLRVNPTIQNFCRLIMQCIWYLGFLVLLWVVVNWVWSKVVAVLRWLWSMFDV